MIWYDFYIISIGIPYKQQRGRYSINTFSPVGLCKVSLWDIGACRIVFIAMVVLHMPPRNWIEDCGVIFMWFLYDFYVIFIWLVNEFPMMLYDFYMICTGILYMQQQGRYGMNMFSPVRLWEMVHELFEHVEAYSLRWLCWTCHLGILSRMPTLRSNRVVLLVLSIFVFGRDSVAGILSLEDTAEKQSFCRIAIHVAHTGTFE